VEAKRDLIKENGEAISIRRQCELVGLNRASYYYAAASETAENLQLMRLLDEQYMQTPFYGYRRMTVCLRGAGYLVNPKRTARLMGVMGIEAIYPKPQTTMVNPAHKIYPYLLRGVQITHPNQVWSTDITYLPLAGGFMYLTAVIDWFSRYVLTWRLSNTLDSLFCVEALSQALTLGKPEIFNSDQGVQFTALSFTSLLQQADIQISMDGRGRALDNIFIERFWRSLKYEDIYLNCYDSVPLLVLGLTRYFDLYNYQRPHQSLGYQTPALVYSRGIQSF
jgi:putative transposase